MIRPFPSPNCKTLLADRVKANANVPVYISGTRDATHGSVVYVLDLVKRAGIQRVAIAVKTPEPSPRLNLP